MWRKMMNKQISAINALGRELVNCPLDCTGIDNSKKEGMIPRCINLEYENRNPSGKSVIIAGMNPGRAKPKERELYIKNNCSYPSHTEFMKNMLKEGKNKYHSEIKEVVNLLGFEGFILWSEIVKCQSKKDSKHLDVQTIRNCAHRFLKKEIELFPNSPIIAIGNESFKTCSLLFPERQIIGIEHPSGKNRNYNLFKKNLLKNKNLIKEKIKNLNENEAIHLNDLIIRLIKNKDVKEKE
jgi:hypothetical protein